MAAVVYITAVALLFAGFSVPGWILESVPDYVQAENLRLMFSSLVEVDGIILGLGEVLFGFLLSSSNEQMRDLTRLLKEQDQSSGVYRVNERRLSKLRKDRFWLVWSMCATMLFFGISIVSSFRAMGNIPGPSQTFGNSILYGPIAGMVLGFASIIITFAANAIELPSSD
ncbi:MAG: hypothetical protein M1387_07155 [Thaumarchaeota archaeon]|nr:hypothetical protein [Nitrososphaerota archaeon]